MDARVYISLNSQDISNLQYPIIVECWEKKNCGRVRRAWLKEFNEKERAVAGKLYKLFYQWHLVKGAPQTKLFHHSTVTFIHRLVHFFATNC